MHMTAKNSLETEETKTLIRVRNNKNTLSHNKWCTEKYNPEITNLMVEVLEFKMATTPNWLQLK